MNIQSFMSFFMLFLVFDCYLNIQMEMFVNDAPNTEIKIGKKFCSLFVVSWGIKARINKVIVKNFLIVTAQEREGIMRNSRVINGFLKFKLINPKSPEGSRIDLICFSHT